ncbi:MAG: transcriptional repressor [Zoogloeaceae bacterium]|nr:transcriptional repressor [Zoogloeaceae bacterium]
MPNAQPRTTDHRLQSEQSARALRSLSSLLPPEDEIDRRLRAARLRPTLARRQVLETLRDAPECPSMKEICHKLNNRYPACTGSFRTSSLYRALRDLRRTGLVLCFTDERRATRYCLPHADETPLFAITRHAPGEDQEEDITFPDPELYARILLATARQGLRLEGQTFALHVHFQKDD